MANLEEALTEFPYKFIVGNHYEPPSAEWLNRFSNPIVKTGHKLLELPGKIFVCYSGIFQETDYSFATLIIPQENQFNSKSVRRYRHGVIDLQTGKLYFFYQGKTEAMTREQAKRLFQYLLNSYGENDPITGFRKHKILFAMRDLPLKIV